MTEHLIAIDELKCLEVSESEGRQSFFAWLDALRYLREVLNCSGRNAWFRGHEDKAFALQPALFRNLGLTRPDLQARLERWKSDDEAERKRRKALRVNYDLIKSKVDSASPAAESLSDELRRSLATDKNQLKGAQAAIKVSLRRSHDLKLKWKIWRELGHGDLDIHDEIFAIDSFINSGGAAEDPHSLELMTMRAALLALGSGERDAYQAWRCRSGRNYDSSWEALAEMQHYRVATRLLDWTESVAIGCFFALKHYRRILDAVARKMGREMHERFGRSLLVPMSDNHVAIPEPQLWVLNPYKLAQTENKWRRLSLLEPFCDEQYDYAKAFLERKSWHFRQPMPFLPRWNDRRLNAQMGLFTVFGLDRRPLEEQLGEPKQRHYMHADGGATEVFIFGNRREDFLGRIGMPPAVAVYALRHMREFTSQSDYAVFRDSDSLGMFIQDRLIDPITKFR